MLSSNFSLLLVEEISTYFQANRHAFPGSIRQIAEQFGTLIILLLDGTLIVLFITNPLLVS